MQIVWRKQWTRAVLQGIIVALTGLMIYQGVPTSWDALWQPVGQGMLTTATALLVNVGTRKMG